VHSKKQRHDREWFATEVGQGPSRRIRGTGLVPAVLYGRTARRRCSWRSKKIRLNRKNRHPTPFKKTRDSSSSSRALARRPRGSRNPGRPGVPAEFCTPTSIEVRLDEKIRGNVSVVLTWRGRRVQRTAGNRHTRSIPCSWQLLLLCPSKRFPVNIEVAIPPLKDAATRIPRRGLRLRQGP